MQTITAVDTNANTITVQGLLYAHSATNGPFPVVQASAKGLLIGEWYEYTPTSGTDIAVSNSLRNLVLRRWAVWKLLKKYSCKLLSAQRANAKFFDPIHDMYNRRRGECETSASCPRPHYTTIPTIPVCAAHGQRTKVVPGGTVVDGQLGGGIYLRTLCIPRHGRRDSNGSRPFASSVYLRLVGRP